ncbi:succinate dehydrogenase assembly factor 2 [Methylobacter sp. BlB1]|uniref:FAD assembly factor SdhE n=1 Tax=Methylobacter sp. BlB1 TaxID=2785914 RepID=UPI001893813D|nr:succinate dehydrogenase assembly factor 2 [Methylobacter sp. BlB1]MBF6648259.1 succinate dehydrogenase assembly factor 2 [Methylobacter sp. BlB1]
MVSEEKLRWLCRRGSLELDKMLNLYLEHAYLKAGHVEQQLFQALLNFSDAELLRFLVDGQVPEAKGMDALVKKIRSLSAAGT